MAAKTVFDAAFDPLRARWNTFESSQRRLLAIGAALLAAGVLIAFVWLPAVRTRDALTVRLPQLEANLASMKTQAKEVKYLAAALTTMTVRANVAVADVNTLQAIFGPDAQVAATNDGFRVVIPAIDYTRWWDKTGELLTRHALIVRTAALAQASGAKADSPLVSVDMQLAAPARVRRDAAPAK
ncbi:MAG: type II secretion system protein GspM [Usitatibacteraceae bacterium]